MRRRDFLVAGASTVTGLSSLAMTGRPGHGQDTATSLRRTWICPPNRFEIALDGASLTVDCYPPKVSQESARGGPVLKGEAMVAIGPRRRPVFWKLAAWHQPDSVTQILLLQARDQPLQAEVSFRYDETSGFVIRRTRLLNHGSDREVDIRTTLAFSFAIHEPIRRIIYLSGGWEEEADIQRMGATDAAVVLESRAGMTGFEFQPYVALRGTSTTYVCQILWSGNWALRVVPHEGGATLFGGLNNWRFRHRLVSGGELVLPTVLFVRFDGTPGSAARRLHDYRRAHRPDRDRIIPVQYNSWYPYQGEPTAEALLPLVPVVKQLGCEAFVIDAGWYRTDDGDSATDWDERTGDWRVSRRRFPSGLREISERCHELGLRFGLWFEPEVIAPTSSIRRDHPDWLHHIGGQPPSAGERAVLNLGVPAAQQYVYDRITRILRGARVDWIKWDFNADLTSGGWAPTLPKNMIGQAPLVAHYQALYRLQDAIRAEFPDLILEMCAGGGGRMDGEILSHAHVNWMSDQIGALRKLAIHFGTQLAHPAVVCNDWLIDWLGNNGDGQQDTLVDPRGDLLFRLRVAMLGSFGISAPVDRWPDADIRVAAAHVELYKDRLRFIIHHGDQYYLTPPPPPDGNGDWAAIWYAAKDASAGVLFAFRLAGPHPGRVFQIPGLRKDQRYRVSLFSGETTVRSGEALAMGFVVKIAESFRSELCLIEALPG